HLDVAMHIAENCNVHTFEPIVCDVHCMVEMCMCDVARMAVMGMWFHRMAVMGIGYNSGMCCHMVDVGCRTMVVHFLKILDHVVYVLTCKLVFLGYQGTSSIYGAIQGNKSVSYGHGWKQPDCANCFWYMQRGNRHPSIALAVHNKFPLAFHVDVQPDAYHKLCQAGPQRWSITHCPLVRYNYMTSNSVESVNACTVLKRKLPVTMLAETYCAMVHQIEVANQLDYGHQHVHSPGLSSLMPTKTVEAYEDQDLVFYNDQKEPLLGLSEEFKVINASMVIHASSCTHMTACTSDAKYKWPDDFCDNHASVNAIFKAYPIAKRHNAMKLWCAPRGLAKDFVVAETTSESLYGACESISACPCRVNCGNIKT
nr:transposase, MuDR, MULE transposase domain protein [Tanacetum cinerariifolium]